MYLSGKQVTGQDCRISSSAFKTSHQQCVRSRRCHLDVKARNSPQGNNGSRLIIPGGGSSQQQGQSRLVLPGKERESKKAFIDTSGVPAPSTSSFRPPPGFMDALDANQQAIGPMDPEEARAALDKVRSQAGYWHELAKLFPRLAAAGYDSQVVEMETGLERKVQNSWIASSQVYDSLKASGKISPEKMAVFDSEEAADQLSYMRYLPVAARPATAIYIVDNNLDGVESTVLARAVKEQERREGHKEGFMPTPGDCLAYKYYRDAVESRNELTKAQLVKRGLSVAETDTAKKTLTALLEDEAEAIRVLDQKLPSLNVVRLTGDEVEFRPIPLIGGMGETSAAAVTAAVGVTQSGPYNSFTLTPESAGQEFVALPAFRSLLLAKSPVALSLKNCAAEPLVIRSVQARTEEDKQRQIGPGLVVITRALPESVSPDEFYVQGNGTSKCHIVEGSNLADLSGVCGKVLFICKPPARDCRGKAGQLCPLQRIKRET